MKKELQHLRTIVSILFVEGKISDYSKEAMLNSIKKMEQKLQKKK